MDEDGSIEIRRRSRSRSSRRREVGEEEEGKREGEQW